jgi:outer membrane protein
MTGHYYMGPDNLFFAGLGAGLYFMEQRLDIGVYSITDSTWHVGLAPEVGFSYPLTYDVRTILALRYNYGFQASDTTLSYWTLKVGFVF